MNWPEPYTRRDDHIWMSVNRNEGWYQCVFKDGELTEVYPEAFPGFWNVLKYIGGQQRQRIKEKFQ